MRGWMMEGRAHEVRRRPSLAPPHSWGWGGFQRTSPGSPPGRAGEEAATSGVRRSGQRLLVPTARTDDVNDRTQPEGGSWRGRGGLRCLPLVGYQRGRYPLSQPLLPGRAPAAIRAPPVMDGLPLPPGLPTS